MSTTCATLRAGREPRPQLRSRAARMLTCFALLGVLFGHVANAEAQAPAKRRAIGFWPDLAISLGGGIGIGHPIETNVYAGARLGGLFAYEPWVVNLGVSAEVGALPRRGLGAEFELNYLRGPFVQVAYAKIVGGDWMLRSTVGFALFGVQWQHRMSATTPDNALLFVLRLPLGIGWFFLNAQQRNQRERPPPPPVVERHDG